MFYDQYIKRCNLIGKTPSAVALELGFKKSIVTAWKNGSTPTDANIQKIADYFGISRNELLNDTQLQQPATELLHETRQDLQTKYSRAAVEVADAYERSSLELRAAVRRVLGLPEEPPVSKGKAM